MTETVSIAYYTNPCYYINGNQGTIVGQSPVMMDLFDLLNRLANLPTTVLLRGETGTGKELFARALHYNSTTHNGSPFVPVNCAAIPSELLESELFGYVRGAFTGAVRTTEGKFQYANGGTIFLDEIGDMSPSLQVKILRALQEKQITKVGSPTSESIDVRVVAATNRDLERLIQERKFREDLYYRLNVIPVQVPSLADRRSDIPLIAEHLIQMMNERYHAHVDGLTPEAAKLLTETSWKGNVRELENVIERAFVYRREGRITPKDLFLNGDMPRRSGARLGVRVHPGEAYDTEQTDGAKPLWYGRGVLPIMSGSLSDYDGVVSRTLMHYHIPRNNVYVDRLHCGQRNFAVLYLTPENLHYFLRTASRGYEDLRSAIMENITFNDIVRQPFKVFSLRELSTHPHVVNSSQLLQGAIVRANAYVLRGKGIRGLKAVFITEATAHHFAQPDHVVALQEELHEAYQRFQTWRPNRAA